FFFSSRRRHTRCLSDWSSDVCSSDLEEFGRVRCEIVARSGEVIPVDLSAAIVTEDGRDTATVGVFRDLREELRRESELQDARAEIGRASCRERVGNWVRDQRLYKKRD